MISYVPCANRFLSLLSTYHKKLEIDSTQKRKPNILTFYNETKCGVDTMDQIIGTYRCKRKVNRWPMALFCDILDISAYNAFVIFISIFPLWNGGVRDKTIRRHLFLVELDNALVEPYTTARKSRPHQSTSNAPEHTEEEEITHLSLSNKRGNCYICSYRINKTVFSTRCDKCKKYICTQHKYSICCNCAKKLKKLKIARFHSE